MQNPQFDTYAVIRRCRKAVEAMTEFNRKQAETRINQLVKYTRVGDLVSFRLAAIEFETNYGCKVLLTRY